MKVAILGHGFVGTATEYFLKEYCSDKVSEVFVEDPGKGMYIDTNDWEQVKYTFICVPTDSFDAKLDLNILFKALKRAHGIPVIRSTVGPDQMPLIAMAANKQFMHWPEFLRENHWKQDVDDKSIPVVIGGQENMTDSFVNCILPEDRIIYEGNVKEAAMMKLSRNAMLAAKVAQSNHLYDACQSLGCSYELVKQFLIQDDTLGATHWDVPGFDGDRGFGGKCLPKDTKHYESMFKDDNMYTALLDYNSSLRNA